MKVDEVLSSARDTFTVKRVYGEPYEKDGLTVIPCSGGQMRCRWGHRSRRNGPGG